MTINLSLYSNDKKFTYNKNEKCGDVKESETIKIIFLLEHKSLAEMLMYKNDKISIYRGTKYIWN